MAKFSLRDQPEVFVSDTSISRYVHEAVAQGKLRNIGSRLYTRNLREDPETLVRRNWYYLISAYFPDTLIADRTALEHQPAEDGSVFLISARKREVNLPGLALRPRKGAPPLESDRPFVGGVRLTSLARAYLENMRPSRARGGRVARTLSRPEIEERLDRLLRQQGDAALNRLKEEARSLAPPLGLEEESEKLGELIGTLLGTKESALESDIAKSRAVGKAFDLHRITLFETLFRALRETIPPVRPAKGRSVTANAYLSFFEAYFSNFIEGTEFEVSEAADIVFKGKIPSERPADAHDILGTYRLVSDPSEMSIRADHFDEFIELLQRRHAVLLEQRPDKNPGTFKTKENRAGSIVFVVPDLVLGTLEKGFAFLGSLGDPFCRAVFMMFLVSEVHPFVDGNGRAGRIMMNAELIGAEEERIIIPTVCRGNYLSALKALSQSGHPDALIAMLEFAQRYTHSIDWSDFEESRNTLQLTNAFADGEERTLQLPPE
jgi:hypothetical protein